MTLDQAYRKVLLMESRVSPVETAVGNYMVLTDFVDLEVYVPVDGGRVRFRVTDSAGLDEDDIKAAVDGFKAPEDVFNFLRRMSDTGDLRTSFDVVRKV